MSASSAFVDLLEQLDMWWPEGDGNALREAADGWLKTADLIDEITGVLDAVATRLTDNYRGEAADRFSQTWARWVDPHHHGYLGLTATDCRQLAAALTDFASDIDVADRTLVQLIEQALQAAASKPNPLNPRLIPQDWLSWLRSSGDQLFTHLSAQTCVLTTELDSTAGTCSLPPAPGDQPDLSAIISTNITWPDPGTPTDLTGVATGEVNFGSGQGLGPPSGLPRDHLPSGLPWAPNLPNRGAPVVPHGPGMRPPSGAGPGTNGLGTNGSGAQGPPSVAVPTQPAANGPTAPPIAPSDTPPVTPSVTPSNTATPGYVAIVPLLTSEVATQVIPQVIPVTAMSMASPIAAPLVEARVTPPSAESCSDSSETVDRLTPPLTDQAFDKLVDDLFLPGEADQKLDPTGSGTPKPVPLPQPKNPFKLRPASSNFNPNPTLFRPSAIIDNVPQVPKVGTESVSFGLPAAQAIPAAATLAAGAGAIAKAKTRGSGFPMMPMGGGAMAGGDDSNEPKRAGRKRAVTPPPIVQ